MKQDHDSLAEEQRRDIELGAALAALPHPELPEDMDARLRAALGREQIEARRPKSPGHSRRRWPLIAAAAAVAAAAVWALVFLWPGVPGIRTAMPPRAMALLHLELHPLGTWAPRAETRFFFDRGMVYWAVMPWTTHGSARLYRFDPRTGAVTDLRRADKALRGRHVTDVAIGGRHIGVLEWEVLWRAANGTDGFRGLLREPLSVDTMPGMDLTPIRPESVGLVGNGGLFSRQGLESTDEVLVWHDLRMIAPPRASLPPEGSQDFPKIQKGRGGLWAHVFASGRTFRVPDFPGRDLAQLPALAGSVAYWPSHTSPRKSEPIVACDLVSGARSNVPLSEDAATLGASWQDSIAADANVVAWTAKAGSATTLSGYDRRSRKAIPVVSDPAVGGDFVVWLDSRRGAKAPDVYALDLQTGREFLVAKDGNPKSGLSIDGNRVYWTSEHPMVGGGLRVTLYGVSLVRQDSGVRVENLVPAEDQ